MLALRCLIISSQTQDTVILSRRQGGEGGRMVFRALVGRGVPFSKAIERRGVHFCDGKKGGTIFALSRFHPHRGALPPGYNGPHEKAPPERGTFFWLEVYKRVGIEVPV